MAGIERINASVLLSEFDKGIEDLSHWDVAVHSYTFDLTRAPNGLEVGLRANFGDFIGIRVFQIGLTSPCNGKLQINDQVIFINDINLINADLSDDGALNIIKQQLAKSPNRVTLGVARTQSVNGAGVLNPILFSPSQRVIEVMLHREALAEQALSSPLSPRSPISRTNSMRRQILIESADDIPASSASSLSLTQRSFSVKHPAQAPPHAHPLAHRSSSWHPSLRNQSQVQVLPVARSTSPPSVTVTEFQPSGNLRRTESHRERPHLRHGSLSPRDRVASMDRHLNLRRIPSSDHHRSFAGVDHGASPRTASVEGLGPKASGLSPSSAALEAPSLQRHATSRVRTISSDEVFTNDRSASNTRTASFSGRFSSPTSASPATSRVNGSVSASASANHLSLARSSSDRHARSPPSSSSSHSRRSSEKKARHVSEGSTSSYSKHGQHILSADDSRQISSLDPNGVSEV